MREVGIDLHAAGAIPKKLSNDMVQVADVVVTMGCGDSCPVYPGIRYEDWAVEDPAGQDLDTVRRIRDDIRRRVVAFLESESRNG